MLRQHGWTRRVSRAHVRDRRSHRADAASQRRPFLDVMAEEMTVGARAQLPRGRHPAAGRSDSDEPGHRPRDRPGARADAAGHDDRVRRQPHLDARRVRRDRVRHRHLAGARRAGVAVPRARSAEGAAHRRQRHGWRRGVYAKDVILTIIRRLGVQGGVGYAYEYGGDDDRRDDDRRADDDLQHVDRRRRARRLRQPRRDDVRVTCAAGRSRRRATRSIARVAWWRQIASDADARYDDRVTFDAAAIEPTVTWGINPGQSVGDRPSRSPADAGRRSAGVHGLHARARACRARSIDVAFIGSCTNGRLSDLRGGGARRPRAPRRAARQGARRARLAGGAAGGRSAKGCDEVFIDAGFEWRGAGCSMCLAMNPDRLEGRQVCASSSNRNFKGRQGSPTGRTLLMSPAMVAAAAIAGEVVDVREMLDGGAGMSRRDAFARSRGRGLPLRGDDIDTDRIMPARFLRVGHVRRARASTCSRTIAQADPARIRSTIRATPARRSSSSTRNFGCGSSREHAPQGHLPPRHPRRSSASRSRRSSSATPSCSGCRASGGRRATRRRADGGRRAAIPSRRDRASIWTRCRCTAAGAHVSGDAAARRAAKRSSTGSGMPTGLLLDDFDEVARQPRGCPTCAGRSLIRGFTARTPRHALSRVAARRAPFACCSRRDVGRRDQEMTGTPRGVFRPDRFQERVGGATQLAALRQTRRDLTLGDSARGPDGDEPAARDLGDRAAPRQQRDAEPISTARLMPSRLGSAITMLSGDVPLLEEAQHALARRRRIVVRDHGLAPDLLHRDLRRRGERMRGRHQQHELVGARATSSSPSSAG